MRKPTVAESKGHKKLRKAAIETISHWRFAPKFEDGKPVEATRSYTLEFRIAD